MAYVKDNEILINFLKLGMFNIMYLLEHFPVNDVHWRYQGHIFSVEI